MSTDLIARLQVCANFDPDQAEAIAVIQSQAAEIARLRAELDIARCNDMGDAWIAQKHAWQEAIEDALLQWSDAPSEGETPKDALRRLIQHEITAALDPAVSQAAASITAQENAQIIGFSKMIAKALHEMADEIQTKLEEKDREP